ncbi:MAG TPA: DUF4936 family protein [Burkholderiaceae bacterium]|nr:DUF4936 family protein [Burkholderiaceae bacterium]
MPAPRELYVYYRVASADLAPVTRAVREAQRYWCAQHPGLRAGLLRRADDGAPGGLVTLMETYGQPGGVSAEMQAALETAFGAVLATWLRSPRHVEVFMPCA